LVSLPLLPLLFSENTVTFNVKAYIRASIIIVTIQYDTMEYNINVRLKADE